MGLESKLRGRGSPHRYVFDVYALDWECYAVIAQFTTAIRLPAAGRNIGHNETFCPMCLLLRYCRIAAGDRALDFLPLFLFCKPQFVRLLRSRRTWRRPLILSV